MHAHNQKANLMKESAIGFLIVMPKIARPTLETAIFGKKDFEDFGIIITFFEKLVKAFQCMHEAGFVHADIKPENIFVSSSLNPIIYDFNISTRINKLDTPKGTLNFISPEFLEALESNSLVKYTPKVDIYSLGIVLYNMLFKKLPYTSVDSLQVLKNTKIKILADLQKTVVLILRRTICLPEYRMSLEDIDNEIFRMRLKKGKEPILKYGLQFEIQEDPEQSMIRMNGCRLHARILLSVISVFLFFFQS